MTDFIALFHLVEYLNGIRGFNSDESIEEVMVDLECNLEHYISKENKTLRDKFEIIQTKFFIEEIKNACSVSAFKTSGELAKSFASHLERYYLEYLNYLEKRKINEAR